MSLEYWKDRLDRHFRSLAALRNNSKLPLFALEHGLSTDEITQISNLLRGQISTGKLLDEYWLLWVVYATEIGYEYTGHEYWQSFSEQTPCWEPHHRPLLRGWFGKFQDIYDGVKPSGLWAKQFPIIAMPITHAVLPKYLQYCFAAALYQLRFRLAKLGKLDILSVRRLLITGTYNTTTRFEQFLQQEELTGRIVLALLNQEPQDGQEPIHLPTLRRIVDDLNQVRNTRAWLKETLTVVDRYRGIGQGVASSHNPTHIHSLEQKVESSIQQSIRPNIFLRYSGIDKWVVVMEIPSFAPLTATGQDLKIFLEQTRCRLAGATDMKPAGWTLTGRRFGLLKSWPDDHTLLIEFEKVHKVLNILQEDFKMSKGPTWLFRIGMDGKAREIKGRNVHPGVKYILVSTNNLSSTIYPFMIPCSLDCSGATAVQIVVPQKLNSEQISQLKTLGLEVVRTIHVWPAGQPCRKWNDEGDSEWLTTESPRFGIVHDYPVKSYLICLNKDAQLTIDAPEAGRPTYIEVEPLPTGRHILTVTAQRESPLTDGEDIVTGRVELEVREPEPWVPGAPAHTGLTVDVDPHDSNFDELWANTINLSINGPESHCVQCLLKFEDGDGKQTFKQPIGKLWELPVTPPIWREQFNLFLEKYENASWRYLEASAGVLIILAGELGNFSLRFDRDIPSIRWVARHHHGNVMLRLIDDTGIESNQAVCQMFSMDRPTVATIPDLLSLFDGISPQSPGGLYVARHGDYEDSIIVSSLTNSRGLQDQKIDPDFSDIHEGTTSIATGIHILTRWKKTRLAGVVAVAEYQRSKIARKLHCALYEKLCGPKWARAEADFFEDPSSPHIVEALQKRIGRSLGFGEAIKSHLIPFADFEQFAQWYFDRACHHNVCADVELCRFALYFACKPHTLLDTYNSYNLERLMDMASSNPELLRGARYATLLLDALP